MRSPELSRLYVQCRPDEDIAEWPDERIWEELQVRLGLPGWTLAEGPVLEKGITPMRSFVAEPMRHGRLFLAGDAAHIVPPTGAKGLNLAVHDVRLLAEALAALVRAPATSGLLDSYSTTCLRRVWRAEHFSWWMTTMLHRARGRRSVRAAAAGVAAALRRPARGRPRRRSPRTTSGSTRSDACPDPFGLRARRARRGRRGASRIDLPQDLHEHTVRVDDAAEGGALGAPFQGVSRPARSPPTPVRRGDLVLGVGEERERQRELRPELDVRGLPVRADAEHHGAALLERGPRVSNPACLSRAAGCVVLGVEVEDDGPSAQRRQPDPSAPVSLGKLEVRCELALLKHTGRV